MERNVHLAKILSLFNAYMPTAAEVMKLQNSSLYGSGLIDYKAQASRRDNRKTGARDHRPRSQRKRRIHQRQQLSRSGRHAR
jgi:hypothetical protein